MRIKQFLIYTVEAILRVLDSEPIGMNVSDIVQFLWGAACVVLLIFLAGTVHYHAVECVKKILSKPKNEAKRKLPCRKNVHNQDLIRKE